MMLSEENIQSKKKIEDMQKLMHIFAHDLRNPLLNINALVQETNELIQDIKQAQFLGQQQTLDDILNKELPDVLNMLKTSANRMDEMVSGVNDISHCVFDELEYETVDMREMFLRCFFLLKLAEKGFELNYEGAEYKCHADPLAVQRIVSELLNNAEKAIDVQQGSKLINIKAYPDTEFIYFQVEDSGCGFEEKEIPNVFAPFFCGNNFKNGTGMGLARVKAWVEHHGGSIHAETDNGKTAVRFCLPKAG